MNDQIAAPAGAVFPTGTWLWAAAAAAFLLLCLSGPAAEIWTSRRRDGGPRLLRAALILLILALGALPPLLVWEAGAGVLFHAVFFPLFCYGLGKKSGWLAGRDHLSELLGIESRENLEDVQERLFESQMRLASRVEVVKSIADQTRAEDGRRQAAPGGETRETRSGSGEAAGNPSRPATAPTEAPPPAVS